MRISLLLAALGGLLSASTLACAAPGIGDVPPPDVGITLEGAPVSLASHQGKAIVVSFWATWCPYCLKELPILEGIQNATGSQHMQVIAVNTENRDVFRQVVKQLKTLNLQLTRDAGGQAQAAYGVNGLPHMVIIGRDGRILRVYRGYNERQLDSIVADINRATGAAPAPDQP
jgi:thiol-disulfide isomerase/thioredoxin